MGVDYSVLFESEDGLTDTWREVYDSSSPLSWNLLNILRCTILLPHDFYDIIATYFLLPSVLCRNIPYLFLYGQSGSGKSTAAKLASYLHGVSINSSSDTFAGIRNELDKRRYKGVDVPDPDEPGKTRYVHCEQNTFMVWDDVDATVFSSQPDLYRLFKFGVDKTTDKITLSGKDTGTNLEFRTFCPKVFSSISPLHLDDRFRELKRRLIVIPCKRVEELSDKRKVELNITDNNWQSKLLDLGAYNWKGLKHEFAEFWDLEQGKAFLDTRKLLGSSINGLGSQQRAISLDLLACGIVSGVWADENIALERIKTYWNWFRQETEKNASLGSLLRDYIRQEEKNARNGGKALEINTPCLRRQVTHWFDAGWLYEKPRLKEVKELMLDNGMRLQKGIWKRG